MLWQRGNMAMEIGWVGRRVREPRETECSGVEIG